MRHYKKLQTKRFYEVKNNEKSFLLTEDNENYNVGDIIVLDEFNSSNKATGNAIARTIGYIERDNVDGLGKGYCVLGLKGGK
jgi:hypothetical protein